VWRLTRVMRLARTSASSSLVGLRRRKEEEEERQPHQHQHQRNQRQNLDSDPCNSRPPPPPPPFSLKTNSRIFFSPSGPIRLAVQPLKHSFFSFPLFIFVCCVCTVFSLSALPQNFLVSHTYLLTHYLQRRQERFLYSSLTLPALWITLITPNCTI
jgi:hypothetical protein